VSWEGAPPQAISCGKSYSLAVRDGAVFSWGCGAKGVLGHGDDKDVGNASRLAASRLSASRGVSQGWVGKTQVDVPKRVAALEKVRIVGAAGGWMHTVLVDDKGAVYALGSRDYGKLGF
jgi:alpha-tubulin suppressor-like RCC1 family protein